MKRRERVSSFLIVEAGLILLNILCYGDIRWLLLEQILLFPCFNVLKRKKREKEKHLYEKGFQNLLQSMMTSLQAGYSLNNSCRIALKELEELYQDQNNPMLRQMRRIIQGLDLHITLEQLFMEFAESTGLEEAKQFAVVIEIVRSTGGNMVEILKRTMQHLKYKMDTEEEIRVLLSGKLFEKNIMLSMPFFILLYLRLANPEYVECFYNTILGHLVMSGMIGITVFSFFLVGENYEYSVLNRRCITFELTFLFHGQTKDREPDNQRFRVASIRNQKNRSDKGRSSF